MDAKETNRIFKNTIQFVEWWCVDMFQWTEGRLYEMTTKYWIDLQCLCDRLIFQHSSNPRLLKNEEQRQWFNLFAEKLFDLLNENIDNVEDKRVTEDIEQ